MSTLAFPFIVSPLRQALSQLSLPWRAFSNYGRICSRNANKFCPFASVSTFVSSKPLACQFASCTDPVGLPGTNSHASSAVKARIGASIWHRPVTSRCSAVCVERRRVRIRGVGVEPVFDDVVIDRREFHGDELAELLIDDVEFVLVVGGEDFGFELREFAENPAVEAGQSCRPPRSVSPDQNRKGSRAGSAARCGCRDRSRRPC